MKLLLDTHVWLWSHAAPERLSKRTRARLSAAAADLWLSPVSIWELFLLCERGRVRLSPSPRSWIDQALAKAPLRDARLTWAVALLSRSIELEHQDPADRFLAATAAVLDLTLVTADESLLRGKGYRVLSAN